MPERLNLTLPCASCVKSLLRDDPGGTPAVECRKFIALYNACNGGGGDVLKCASRVYKKVGRGCHIPQDPNTLSRDASSSFGRQKVRVITGVVGVTVVERGAAV